MKAYGRPTRSQLSLVGAVFGNLTVGSLLGTYRGKTYWSCLCACGQPVEATTSALRTGHTKSCGCVRNEKTRLRSVTHGLSGHPIYRIWCSMHSRCRRLGDSEYHNYGGRGITVCPEWGDFAVFLKDVGERPVGQTLERRNNDEGYCPANVKWASPMEQAQNRRSTKLLTHQGRQLSIAAWAREFGLSPSTLRARIVRLGYTVSDALTREVKPRERMMKND